MKKIQIFILVVVVTGCFKPIKLNRQYEEMEKISFFGVKTQNNFFIDEIKTEFLQYEWDIRTHGSFRNTSFVAIDSLLIIPDLSGRITVHSTKDGKKKAEIKYSGGIEQSPIILKSYMIFIVNEQKEKYSTLVVYDLVNGKEVRDLKLIGKFGNELVVVGDFIYAVSSNGLVYKIANWGNIEWQVDLNRNVYSNPISDGKVLYLATSVGEIISLNLENGNTISKYNISNGFESGINLDQHNLFIGDNEGVVYSIKKADGIVNWSFRSASKIVQTPGLDEDNIYFGNLSGDILSLDKKDGRMNWIYQTKGLINISPLIFRNIIIQPNLFRTVDIINKQNGELLNQIEFDTRCRTTPVYFNNRIFFGVDKGEVYCYSFVQENITKGK